MTHMSIRAAASSAATCLAVMLASAADVSHAQCETCATPTVAYAPVVAAPTTVVVAPRPGLFDRWRLRRWGYATPVVAAPAYTAAYAPAYTAAYAPSYTAAYAPTYATAYAPAYTAAYAPAYTAAYAPAASPYLTSYAPLQAPVMQTSYLPAPATTSCCATTAMYQPAVLTPVVSQPACTTCAMPTTCTACSAPAPCSACAAAGAPCSACAAAGYVDQAAYAAPAPGCSTCASASGTPQYSTGSVGTGGGPPTPAPAIDPPAPTSSSYPFDPGPYPEDASLTAPQLIGPVNDQTARAPTVDIHTAVYRRPVGASSVSTTAARPVSSTPAVDNTPWTAIP